MAASTNWELTEMQYQKLGNTSLNVSKLSYGASPLGGVYGDVDQSQATRTVHAALDLGINFIDCSPYYGMTKAETMLGKALKGIPRDQYFLSTKAGRYGPEDFDMSEQRIRKSLDESLERLGVEEVDVFFLHDIEFVDLDIVLHESLPCMEKLKEEGRIRYYGITGYPLKPFREVIRQFQVDCILSYCRYGLHDTSLASLLDYLDENEVGVVNASPACMGLLTSRGAPDWHPAGSDLRKRAQKAVDFCQAQGVDITQIALQFSAQHSGIPTTLVGTANPAFIAQNVEWINEPLSTELVDEVRSILAGPDSVWSSGLPENNDL